MQSPDNAAEMDVSRGVGTGLGGADGTVLGGIGSESDADPRDPLAEAEAAGIAVDARVMLVGLGFARDVPLVSAAWRAAKDECSSNRRRSKLPQS